MPSPYPSLDDLFTQLLSGTDAEARAMTENFSCDERPPAAGRMLYERHVAGTSPVDSLEVWRERHDIFLENELFVDAEDLSGQLPWTFRADNAANHIHPDVARERKLVRLEDANHAVRLVGGYTVDVLMDQIVSFQGDDATKKAVAKVELDKFFNKWNKKRDLRPVFAAYLDEVDDLIDQPDWPDRVRDRLGMGHLHPNVSTGAPVPVLLLHYRVEETMGNGAGVPKLAIPTVLDGKINPYFFPTPQPGAGAVPEKSGGRAVNLSRVSENDYSYGVELLHPKLDYQLGHLKGGGWIRRPPGLELATVRPWHLELLRVYMNRADYGGSVGR